MKFLLLFVLMVFVSCSRSDRETISEDNKNGIVDEFEFKCGNATAIRIDKIVGSRDMEFMNSKTINVLASGHFPVITEMENSYIIKKRETADGSRDDRTLIGWTDEMQN